MSLFGSVFGDAKDADSGAGSAELAKISKQLLSETSPLRGAFIDRYSNLLGAPSAAPVAPAPYGGIDTTGANIGDIWSGHGWVNPRSWAWTQDEQGQTAEEYYKGAPVYNGPMVTPAIQAAPVPTATRPFDVTSQPQFASLKDAINRQFQIAKNNTIATNAPGGALTGALSNLEGQRAGATAAGIGDLAEREMTRAFALATGSVPTALGGLGSAAGISGNIASAQAAQQGQALAGLGYGAGQMIGRKAPTALTQTAAPAGAKGGAAALAAV